MLALVMVLLSGLFIDYFGNAWILKESKQCFLSLPIGRIYSCRCTCLGFDFTLCILETVWMPCYDAGNCGSCSWYGGRDAIAPEVSSQVSAKWWLD
ncbi:hypothetical protein SLEP1_g22446 [Rubroshorea leprosula]|uniref:Uncharacterized protein n=1 Tax=Rubroshorea leprosula TaxID=152421 RepID=A0AAV5JC88_9ROSI|nr:hypothetical protein SLEP1_g22446 [Rubroshorea leprosula]